MNIFFDGQLLTTTIYVTYKGLTIQIDDVIVDTGSSHTIISPDVLEEIGVTYENGDPIYEAYGIGGTVPFYTKIIDEIRIGDFIAKNIEIDVGELPKYHNGLLGLDILKEYKFVLDLEQLEMYAKQSF
ncbi:retropepsin-like aspartic protease family protein [Ectobacillus funiculus]|uniref:TIGR02281 family clan AA aspartic protease n=1 Tax=Ectobacillus funiculus TaxID=137993 RepID=A0ABV5WHA4_9BACI